MGSYVSATLLHDPSPGETRVGGLGVAVSILIVRSGELWLSSDSAEQERATWRNDREMSCSCVCFQGDDSRSDPAGGIGKTQTCDDEGFTTGVCLSEGRVLCCIRLLVPCFPLSSRSRVP